MPGRQSPARCTATEAREEFIERATEWWDDFNAWHKAHPEATFDEIESELGRHRRAVLGDFVELSLRQGDLGAIPEAPFCSRCGKPMDWEGHVRRRNGSQAQVYHPMCISPILCRGDVGK